MSVIRRRTLLVPLLLGALAVIAFVVTSIGNTEHSEAATDGPAMTLEVDGQRGKADVQVGATFTVSVIADGVSLAGGATPQRGRIALLPT
jgi:hypothetical protein